MDGTLIAFRVGARDAATLACEGASVFRSDKDFEHFYLKLLIDGEVSKPFSPKLRNIRAGDELAALVTRRSRVHWCDSLFSILLPSLWASGKAGSAKVARCARSLSSALKMECIALPVMRGDGSAGQAAVRRLLNHCHAMSEDFATSSVHFYGAVE